MMATTSQKIRLEVYNISGQLVTELVHGTVFAGEHEVMWNAETQASGIYFIALQTDQQRTQQKLILLK
jgi:hypothetical protein